MSANLSDRLKALLQPVVPVQPIVSAQVITDPVEEALFTPIKKLGDIKRYFEIGLNALMGQERIYIPGMALTEGHTPPLRIYYEIYCLASGMKADGSGLPMTPEEMLAAERAKLFTILLHGPRSGTKTFGVAGIMLKLNLDIASYGSVHTAAAIDQALRVTDYMERFCNNRFMLPKLKGKPGKNKILFKNHSEIQLVTGSTEVGVNSAHKPWFSYDEIESAPEDKVSEAAGIPQGQAARNLPAITVYLSTQKEVGRTMAKMVKKAKQTPPEINYYLWNWLEVTERCPEIRTRDLPKGVRCADFKENARRIRELELRGTINIAEETELQRLQLVQTKLQANCPLVEFCQGKAKLADGYLPIQTNIQRLDLMGRAKFRAQVQCDKPSTENMVYPDFDEENITEEARYVEGCPCIGVIDQGYATDPIAVNFFCLHDAYLDCFAELTMKRRIKTPVLATMAGKWTKDYSVWHWICDNQSAELVDFMNELGLSCDRAGKRPIEEGVDKTTIWLYSEGHRALRFNPKCVNTIFSMQNYKRKDGNIMRKQDDHHPDNVRYCVQAVDEGVHLPGTLESGASRGLNRSR